MAFKLDDIIIDSIDMALATDFNDVPQYVLTQLSEATIEISAESTEAVDKNGTLIKKFYKSKAGTFTATNAMLNLNIVGAMSGEGKKYAAAGADAIVMPKIITVKAGEKVALDGWAAASTPDVDSDATPHDHSISIAAITNSGAMIPGVSYSLTTGAVSTTQYKIVLEDGKYMFYAPLEDATNGVSKFVVLYKRPVESGVMIQNRADKFPDTVRLYIKALCVDPCSADTLRAVTIYLPSFQVEC